MSFMMLKNRLYSIINTTGLSLSFTACLFIFLYVEDELSYDRFHEDARDIYRIALTLQFNDLNVYGPVASAPLGNALQAALPEVKESLRLFGLDVHHAVRNNDLSFTEKRVLYADSNFFSFFSFRLLEGNAKTVLHEPNSLVVTSALASKYFGNGPAVGKIILVDGESFTVTGIAAAPPSNSHIAFDALISMSSFKPASSPSWMGNRFMTYVKLTPDADRYAMEAKLDNLVLQHIGPDLQHSLGISLQEFLKQKNKIGYDLHPLTETHLYSKFPRDLTPAGDITYVYVFIAVAIALLLIACFNFMNLSTAQFMSQVRGISVRKVLGAGRSQLVISFFKESLVLSLTAALISLLLLYFLLPFANSISGKAFSGGVIVSGPCLTAAMLMALASGLLSASYPSFYLTSFNPAHSLRGKTTSYSMSDQIRKALMVFQHGVSIGMIAFTLILFNQIDFISRKNLGFDKGSVVALRNMDRLGNKALSLKNALLNETGILAASFTDRTLFEKMSGEAVRIPNDPLSHIMNFYVSDEDQLKVMGLRLIAGRFFSKDFPSDSNAVVINEAAMKDLGWTDVDTKELAADADIRYKVVGVVNNFNYESLRSEIKPLIIFFSPEPGNTLNIRYSGISPPQLIELLEKHWRAIGNGEPFDYNFLDQDFDALFKAESRVGQLLTLFSFGIIVIACMGLFGLSSFTAEKRSHEIGIRKVLGATVSHIALLLSGQFLKLVAMAFALAVLPTYLMASQWLEGFAFHDAVGVAPFVIAGLSSLLISLLTVSFHSIKAAGLNPVKTLRAE